MEIQIIDSHKITIKVGQAEFDVMAYPFIDSAVLHIWAPEGSCANTDGNHIVFVIPKEKHDPKIK